MNVDFEKVWQEYEKELTNFVRSKLYNTTYTQDIMQEVALKIYKQADNFSKIDDIRAWLYKLTRNTLIDFYKSQDKQVPKELEEFELTISHENEDKNEVARCLMQVSSTLKPVDAKILHLSIFEEYSAKELADSLDLSVEGAKTKLKRAKAKLANKFFSCCELEKDTQNNIIGLKSSCENGCSCP